MPAGRRTTLLLRGVVVLLAIQFVLGIYANLFGPFSSTDSIEEALAYGGAPVLTAHYILAAVLVVLGLVLVASSFGREEPRGLRWLTIAGLLSILWASLSGLEFIRSGFTSNVDSFSMALGFIVATSFYGVAQALALPQETRDSRRDDETRRSAESDSAAR
ncbi:MAG TPA: hypothetical protein VGS23_05985 [Thermoplasmata archaeon]|nr:hypothetical protein [Thermoplasmata archaeon]